MMSPGDSDLQQRMVSAFINYFLSSTTSVSAIEITLACLERIEQEYKHLDSSSWLTLGTSFLPATYTLWKSHHLEKIKICKEELNHVLKHTPENSGKAAIKILLEFFGKSVDWKMAGYVRGPSINMRLTCDLLQAAGVKVDCGSFLNRYPVAFLSELESAVGKIPMPIASLPPVEIIRSSTTKIRQETAPLPITPLKKSINANRSQDKLLVAVLEQENSARQYSEERLKKNTSSPGLYVIE